MQNDTLFSILMSLLARSYTAPELASKYELSVRTVYRYLDTLESAGVPLMRRAGCKGGFYLDSCHIIDKAYFTSEEYRYLSALASGARFGGKTADAVADKIAALCSMRAKSGYTPAPETLVIDADSWSGGSHATITALQRAIETQTSQTVVYIDSGDARTERTVYPHTLVLKGCMWYVYAWCTLRSEWRLFALSRIESLCAAHHFERMDYDLERVPWRTRSTDDDITLKLRFSPAARATLTDRFGSAAIDGDTMSVRLPPTKSLARDLLRWGNAVEVLEPESLRNEIKSLLDAASAVYA